MSLLYELQRGAPVVSDHRTVQIHIVTDARALHLTHALRLGGPWQHQAKECGNVLGTRHHAAPAGPKGQRGPPLSQRKSVLADKEWNRSTCIKRYGVSMR